MGFCPTFVSKKYMLDAKMSYSAVTQAIVSVRISLACQLSFINQIVSFVLRNNMLQ